MFVGILPANRCYWYGHLIVILYTFSCTVLYYGSLILCIPEVIASILLQSHNFLCSLPLTHLSIKYKITESFLENLKIFPVTGERFHSIVTVFDTFIFNWIIVNLIVRDRLNTSVFKMCWFTGNTAKFCKYMLEVRAIPAHICFLFLMNPFIWQPVWIP